LLFGGAAHFLAARDAALAFLKARAAKLCNKSAMVSAQQQRDDKAPRGLVGRGDTS
jgi:hypothetical protein